MGETMRERLERVKSNPDYFDFGLKKNEPTSTEKKLLTPETVYMKKMDKAITAVESLRTRMQSGSDQYLTLYHELKTAEDDFLTLTNDPEIKLMDLPDVFMNKVENTKKKLLTKKI